MRRAAFFVLFFALLLQVKATDVIFSLSDPAMGLSQTTNRAVVVQAESGVTVNGNNVLLPFKITLLTDTNGICVASNLYGSPISGFYHVTIPAPPQRADFDIWVQSTNLGTVYASTIMGVFGANTYPSSAFAWGAGVSDSRYAIGTNQAGSFVQIGEFLSASNTLSADYKTFTEDYVSVSTNFIYTNLVATINSASNTVTTNLYSALGATNSAIQSVINSASNTVTTNLTALVSTTSNALYTAIGSGGQSTNGLYLFTTNLVNVTSNALQTQINTLSSSSNGTFVAASTGLVGTTNSALVTLKVDTNVVPLTSFLGTAAYSNSTAFDAAGAAATAVASYVPTNDAHYLNSLTTLTNEPYLRAKATVEAAGKLGSLVDFASFCSGYYFSNSWRGTPLTFSNCTFTAKGAYMHTNGAVYVPINLSSTNTVFVNWWVNGNFTNDNWGHVFQAMDTNGLSGYGASFQSGDNNGAGWMNEWGYGGGNCYPATTSGFTNLVLYTNGVTSAYDLRGLERYSVAFSSDGHGTLTTWIYNSKCQWQIGATNYFLLYPSNTLNLLVLGNVWTNSNLPSDKRAGSEMYLESFMTFNEACSSNLFYTANRALEWVQPLTKRRIWIGDSLIASPNSAYPNKMSWRVDALAGYGDVLPVHLELGGTRMNQYAVLTNVLNAYPPNNKVTAVNMQVAAGINDIFASSASGTDIFGNLTNLMSAYQNNNKYVWDIWDIKQTSTNGSTDIQTTSSLSNATVFNALVASNRTLFGHVYKRSDLITQAMLSTNRIPQLSADGLHFQGSNGPAAVQMEAGLVIQADTGINPYMLPGEFPNNLPSYAGTNDLLVTSNALQTQITSLGSSSNSVTLTPADTTITVTTNVAGQNYSLKVTANTFDTNGAAAAYTAALARTNGAANLLDYGAVAGGADCFSAVTNAIGAGGHSVILPVGRFRLSQTVPLPSNTTIIAADYVNSVFYSTNNAQMFLVNAGATNITFVGVTLEGNWAGTTQYGFQTGVPNSANISLFHCTFRNLYRGAQFENLAAIAGQPYYQGSFVSGCRFFNCSSAGLYINSGAEYIMVTGNQLYSNALALVVYGGNNNVIGNDFSANITNVFYKAVPLANSDHASFMGNSVNHASSNVGIVTDPIRYGLQIEGNHFYDITNYFAGTNITLLNNTWVNPFQNNIVTFYLTNVDNLRLINNSFPNGSVNIVATNSNWYEQGLDSTNGMFLKHNGTLVFRYDTTGALIANGSGVTNIPIASVVGQSTTNAMIGANATSITALVGATNNLAGRVGFLEGATNGFNTRMTLVEGATNSLDTRVGLLEGATNSLNTTVSGNSSSIAAINNLTNQFGLLNGATNNLNSRVGILEAATNAIAPTSFKLTTGSQASSGNATNYSITLLAGEMAQTINIYLANTNAYLTFSGTNTSDYGRHIVFWGLTNSVNSTVSFNLPSYHTNSTFSSTVSNGWCASFYFWNPDTTGTNVFVTDQGRWK